MTKPLHYSVVPDAIEYAKRFKFEAAHLLPHLPKSHKCRRLHGHSFQGAKLQSRASANPAGLADGLRLHRRRVQNRSWQKLDHIYLNEITASKIPPARTSQYGFGGN